MDATEIELLISKLKMTQTDTQDIEVKASAQKLPANIVETLSAFSNGSGGYVILGLSEDNNFEPVPDFDARKIAESLAQTCADKLAPPVRAAVEIVEYQHSPIVVAQIDELSPQDKPCYVTDRGMYRGSYIRSFDGDRKLSSYEIDRLLEDKTQPTYDLDMVPEATLDDLNQRLLAAVLGRQRMLHPRAFEQARDEEMYLDLRIAVYDKDVLRPTLAGLLALGTYPQKFFPRLTVTFAAYPGTDKADVPDVKFLDNEKMIGPIPAIIADTVAAVRRNMRTGGVMDGIKRVDVPDYPLAAVREAVCNALMHRDYSPAARGTQVQVNLYADRLEFLSPGGLYGTVTADTIGRLGYSSTRNQYLADLLEATPYEFAPYEGSFVAENRGTGFRLMTRALEDNHMQPPIVRDSISMFSLTFKRSGDELDKRLNSSASTSLAGRPHSSASAAWSHHPASPTSAGSLPSATPVGRTPVSSSVFDQVYAYIKDQGPCSASQASQALGISRSTLNYRINKLIEAGRVERLGETRSKNQQYVVTDTRRDRRQAVSVQL